MLRLSWLLRGQSCRYGRESGREKNSIFHRLSAFVASGESLHCFRSHVHVGRVIGHFHERVTRSSAAMRQRRSEAIDGLHSGFRIRAVKRDIPQQIDCARIRAVHSREPLNRFRSNSRASVGIDKGSDSGNYLIGDRMDGVRRRELTSQLGIACTFDQALNESKALATGRAPDPQNWLASEPHPLTNRNKRNTVQFRLAAFAAVKAKENSCSGFRRRRADNR
jgi:hypothetical protein